MKYAPLLFAGLLASLGASWVGMVATPVRQLSGLRAYAATNDAGVVVNYPQARPGAAAQGRELYLSLACASCHSQQVRADESSSDLDRGWGRRRTVARDYLNDEPVALGVSRLGPDLANYGARLGTNDVSMLRLFDPCLVTPGSLCPGAPSLFEKRHIRPAGGSADALKLPGKLAPAAGEEVTPTVEAYQLAAYLRSLRADVDLPEAPLPPADDTAKP